MCNKKVRRSQGDGTVYQAKNGKFIAQKYVSNKDNKTKVRLTASGDTEKKAKMRLYEKIRKFYETGGKEKKSIVVEDESNDKKLLQECVRRNIQNNLQIKETTRETYYDEWRKHIKESWIGKMSIQEITEDDLRRFYRELLDTDLSIRMINIVRMHIKTAFNKALKEGVITKNVHDDIKKFNETRAREEKREVHALTEAEIKCLTEALADSKYKRVYMFTLLTGLRKGEVLGLRWQDIDNESIHISHNLVFVEDKDNRGHKVLELSSPKTKSSNRKIPMNKMIKECLNEQRAEQEKQKMVLKELYMDKDLVFAKENGDFISPRYVLQELKKVYKKAGISKEHHFHDLRHTFASVLMNKDANPKTVSELMGHANVSITLDIYTSIYDKTKMAAMQAVGEVMAGSICV